MEDGPGLCDGALKALPEFKKLISLNVARSDATDAGVAAFKSLSHVICFNALCSRLDGSIFKESSRLQNLKKVWMTGCAIKGKNLQYLSALPRLEDLVLDETCITDDDLKYLPRCSRLIGLHLMSCNRITARSLPIIRQQTNLQFLNVRGTGISLQELLTLKSTKIKTLFITVKRYRPQELAQLHFAFPNAKIEYRGSGITEDQAVIYAPTMRR